MTGQRKAPRPERRQSGWGRETLLTVGAVLGVICIVLALGATFFGLKPLVFRSGSMSPAISTGALAISKEVPAKDVGTDDVVSVVNRAGTRITHRVQSIDTSGGHVMLTLKGDANPTADAETYQVATVDRVLFSVPRAGYVVSFLSSPIGIFAGGAFVACLVFLAFGPRGHAKGSRRAAAVIVVAGLGLGAINGVGATSTLAAFTDTAAMTTGTFTALTVPGATAPVCSTGGGFAGLGTTADITWTTAGSSYSYLVEVRNATSNALVSSTTTTTTSYSVSAALLGNVASTNLTVIITAFPRGVPTWKSSTTVSAAARAKGLGLGAACGNV